MVSIFHDKTLNKSGIDPGLRLYLSPYNHYMKKYLTHKEMIEFLKENKKIIVSDEYSEIYSERNYVSIINPYKTVFSYGTKQNGCHYYKNITSIEDYVRLANLDDDFSNALYRYIGIFEKRLKNEVIDQCCKLYVEKGDANCTTYSQEIKDVIDGKRKTPTFGPNMFKQIGKNGFIDFDNKYQISLLTHIYNLSVNNDSSVFKKSNHLIRHYVKTQQICPLWVIPNGLTLGEINMLFSSLPSSNQKEIVNSITE